MGSPSRVEKTYPELTQTGPAAAFAWDWDFSPYGGPEVSPRVIWTHSFSRISLVPN
jgi:hypothetical protein